MQAISAIFDGNSFTPKEPIPVKGKYEVVITFTKSLDTKDTKRERLLEHFGTWNDDDVKTAQEIVDERANFSIKTSRT